MRCPSCNRENPEGAKFCMDCGTRMPLLCSQCGAVVPAEARFCVECGAQLGGPHRTEEPGQAAARALRRLAPREFAERLLATRGQVAGERRIVTMLFSDVKGSTPMAERLDPEDVLEIMDGAFDLLIEPITRYEGALARLMGMGSWPSSGHPSRMRMTRSGPAGRRWRSWGVRGSTRRVWRRSGGSGASTCGWGSTRGWWWWGRWDRTYGWSTRRWGMR